MTRFFGVHPALIAFLIGAGAFLFGYFGYTVLYHEPSEADKTLSNHDLRVAWQWALTALGAVMYFTGGVLYGRSRTINGFVAFLLHLLPLLGLILMRMMGRELTPHERWERDNPGLDPKTAKRTYRSMKPLY